MLCEIVVRDSATSRMLFSASIISVVMDNPRPLSPLLGNHASCTSTSTSTSEMPRQLPSNIRIDTAFRCRLPKSVNPNRPFSPFQFTINRPASSPRHRKRTSPSPQPQLRAQYRFRCAAAHQLRYTHISGTPVSNLSAPRSRRITSSSCSGWTRSQVTPSSTGPPTGLHRALEESTGVSSRQ